MFVLDQQLVTKQKIKNIQIVNNPNNIQQKNITRHQENKRKLNKTDDKHEP